MRYPAYQKTGNIVRDLPSACLGMILQLIHFLDFMRDWAVLFTVLPTRANVKVTFSNFEAPHHRQ